MKRRWLVLAAAFSACFSEPPGGDSDGSTAGDGSSGRSETGTTSVGSTSPSTGPTTGPTTGTTPGTTVNPTDVSTTDASTSTTDAESTAADTVQDTTDGPGVTFCEKVSGPDTIACTDFDEKSQAEWDQYPASGFMRAVASDPPAHSEPNFVRLTLADEVAQAQALYGVDFPSAVGGVVTMGLQVRYPPNFSAACGEAPVRLLEIRYGADGSFTNVVVAASPQQVVVYLFSPGMNYEVDRFGMGSPGSNAWSSIDVALQLGDQASDSMLTIGANLNSPRVAMVPEFDPAGMPLSVNVGPWFLPDSAPSIDCSYDLDDLLLAQASP